MEAGCFGNDSRCDMSKARIHPSEDTVLTREAASEREGREIDSVEGGSATVRMSMALTLSKYKRDEEVLGRFVRFIPILMPDELPDNWQ